MELYQVSGEYRDVDKWREWEKNPRDLPVPSTKQFTTHVAAHGEFGGGNLRTIGVQAANRVIGPQETWEEYQVVITEVRYIGSVHVVQD